jgi:catechol 2,3-dioxygenase-like lactoylglutathione lyase family enzyme
VAEQDRRGEWGLWNHGWRAPLTLNSGPIGEAGELNALLVVELPVASLEASLAFYRQAGFTVERATATFAAVSWRGTYLFLVESQAFTPASQPPNVRLVVDDLDTAFRQAEGHGWRVRDAPRDRDYGLRDFTVLDPDGYELRFATPLS